MRIRHTYLLAIWLMLVGLLVCPTRAGCAVRDTGESITWWIHVTDSSNFKMISERPTERGWSYHDYSNVEGKLVNRIRLNVARAGTLSLRIKKVDGTIVDKETIHLSNPTTNPTLATMQVIEITPFVLAAGEVIIFGDVDDTGRFCFQAGSLPTPNFSIPVAGNVPYSNNLSIDIGYSPEPQYTLTVAANDKTMGRVTPSGGGKYFDNESIIVEATPEEGYTFFCWSDDNKDNPRTLTITQDTELTAIFQEDITWYVHATASSVFDMLSDGGSGWAYRTVKAEACYNKIINRIRLNVAKAGTFTIGKTDGMTYTRLQTIHLQHPTTSPKQATLQVYPIHPVTLGANERLVLGQPDDTGRFNHHRNTSHKPEGLFDGGITSSRPSGLSISPNNLSIDIGWYPFPILDIYHHDDAPNAEACTQVDATMLAQPIRYYRKFSPGKWETLCLPFNVERITVYDPDDDAEYNLHAQYLYNGVRQAGDFWLYAFHEDVVGLQEFQPNWHEIEATCPAEALPKKNVPYIMMMPAGDYYQDKYVVFHSKREAIALTPFAPVCPTADNQFTYQGNTTLMPQTISHAYLLNTTTDYFVAHETAVLYPFECAVFATQQTTRRLPRLSFTEQDDVTTSIPLPNQADGEAMLFTITGMYIGRYATESELTERIHALPQGWYIIRRNTAVQKIWRADE